MHSSMIRPPKREAIWRWVGESNLAERDFYGPFVAIHRPTFEGFSETKSA